LDWADTIAKFAVLARWVWRGLALTFVGLLTLEFSGDNTEGKTAAYFVKAIAWITIGLGVIYFLMGLTRVNKVRAQESYYALRSRTTE
jgi:cell division protein FtsW (lipid II flippase)